jgi:hypothetical protein
MFSKQNKETKQPIKPEVQDFNVASEDAIADLTPENQSLQEIDTQEPSSVSIVEKISGILSPYFIVLVGLYLYDDNFLFGTALILIGIVSLLRISYEDLVKWFEDLKKILGYNNPSQ